MKRTPFIACISILLILIACLCLRTGTGHKQEVEGQISGRQGGDQRVRPGNSALPSGEDPELLTSSRAKARESRSTRGLEKRSVALPRVSVAYLLELAKRPAGETFELSLGGDRYQAEMESWTDHGEVTSFAVRINEPAGRFQGTLRRDGKLNAEVLFNGKEAAFSLSGMAEAGGWELRPSKLSDLMCVPQGTRYGISEGAALDPTPPPPPGRGTKDAMEAPPLLNSLPGAAYVIYCDFDGETVTHVKWNSGQTIYAQPHPNANDSVFVTRVWKRVAEDFAPFAINVTTERAVFDATPVARRMHCIITPTDTATPGSGGVAYLRSFGDGTPCWTFNQSEFSCADTISHEVGHTLGLSHDGRTGDDSYYGGHGTGATSWAPIMGAAWSDESSSYTEYVTQWSKGEYTNANNTQDDLAIITTGNGFTYRTDDKGSSQAAATAMVFSNGTVSDSGIIERTTDEDWLRFTTSGGTVSFQVNVINVLSSSYPQPGANLAVSLQLVDSAGTVRQSSNPTTTMGASVSATLEAGTYCLRIEGAARGTGSSGFTDYGSIGQYTVTGTVPQTGVNMLAVIPPNASVPAGGGTFTFDVSSNVSWNWTKTDSWVSSSEATPQTGNQTFTYTIAANTGSTQRSATFTFTAGSLSATHTVTQDGSSNDDHGNTIATATVVNPSSSTSGNIGVAGDNDYFRINVASTGVLLVNTTGSTDTYGYLLDSSGTELAYNDDNADANFRISRTVTAGTYYVRVRHYSGSGTGNYVLVSSFSPTVNLSVSPTSISVGAGAIAGSFNVTSNGTWSWNSNASWLTAGELGTQSGNQFFDYSVAANTGSGSRSGTITLISGAVTATHTITQGGSSADDHGNSIATATVVSQNSTVSGTIETSGDNDYFRINVTTAGVLTVRTTGSTDTFGSLLNSSGSELASNDDTSGTNFQIVRDVTAGTYYVRVRHYSTSGTGSYQLVSSFGTGPSDDHGNSIATATVIAPSSTTNGNIEFSNDNDYFRINVTGPGSLVVRSTGSTDTYGSLLNSSGAELVSDDDTDGSNFQVGVNVAAAGTYYVRVQHYSSAGTGAYQLVSSWVGTPAPEITVEYPVGTTLEDGVSTLPFGDVNRGSPATASLTIRNTGNLSLTGIAVTFNGGNTTDFSVVSSPSSTLSPGASTTFNVRFNPQASGARATTLRIASNDANENPFDIALTGTGVAVPEIVVEYPAGTSLTDGAATVAFGSINVGTLLTRTFTVKNPGTAALTDISAAITGGTPGDFVVTTVPAASVAVGTTTTTFVVRFSPSTPGSKTAQLQVTSNDADENPFDITLTGTALPVPEIAVENHLGTDLTDAAATVDFGAVNRGTNVTRSFTVRNRGTATLSSIAATFSGSNASDFTVTAAPAASVVAGDSTVFTVRFAPAGSGARTTTLRIASNDANENPFDITLTGSGVPVPEIAIEYPSGTNLVSGSTAVDFGSINVGANVTRTFTLRNPGTASLTGIAVSLVGGNAGDFTVTTNPAATVAAGSFTSFIVRLAPSAVGLRSATLRVVSNDADENPFDITLTGTGLPVPEIAVENHLGTDLTDAAATVDFGAVNRGSSMTRSFTVRNPGTATLSSIVATFSGGTPSDFTVTAVPATSVLAGDSTVLTVRFTPAANGARTTTLRIASNDANENPFDITLTGSGVAVPEIAIEYPSGTNLVSGSASVDFGLVNVGANVTRTFTLRNPGTASLTGIAVSFLGGNAGEFAVITNPAATVAAGSFTSFTVRLAPSAVGIRSTTLRVASNDADENPFEISIWGGTQSSRQLFDGVAGSAGLTGADAAPGAIPQDDGVKNLIKYAFNMDLGSPDCRTLSSGVGTAGLPAVSIEGSGTSRMIKVEYLRRKGSGLTYQPKLSPSLVAGTFTPMTGTPVVTSIDSQWERVVVSDPATTGRIFAIVEVTIP